MGEGKATPPARAGEGPPALETTDTDDSPVENSSTDSAEEEVVASPEIGGDPLESPPAMGGPACPGPGETGAVNSQAPPSAAATIVGVVEAAARTAGVALGASPSPGEALLAIMTARAAIQAAAAAGAAPVETPSALGGGVASAAGTMGAAGGRLGSASFEQAAAVARAAEAVGTVPSDEPSAATGAAQAARIDARTRPSIVGPTASASMVVAAAAAGRTLMTPRARAAFAEAAGVHTIHPSIDPPRDPVLDMLRRDLRGGTRIPLDPHRPNSAMPVQALAGAGVPGVGVTGAGQGAAMAAAAEAAAAWAAGEEARADAGAAPRWWEGAVGMPGEKVAGAGGLGARVPGIGVPRARAATGAPARGAPSWRADTALKARSRPFVDTWVRSNRAASKRTAGKTPAGDGVMKRKTKLPNQQQQGRRTRKRNAAVAEEGVGNLSDDGAPHRRRSSMIANAGRAVSTPGVAGPRAKDGKDGVGRSEDAGEAREGKTAAGIKTEPTAKVTVENTTCRDDTFTNRNRDEDDEDDESKGGAGSGGEAGGGAGWRTTKRGRPSAPAPGGNT